MKAIVSAALALAAVHAHAQQPAADTWRWEASLYLYLPTISGSTSFPTSGTSVDTGPRDYSDALQAVFMGQIEARRGRWGAWSDLFYIGFENDWLNTRDFTVGRVPVDTEADLTIGLDATVWTLAGTYTADAPWQMPIQLVFGARMLKIRETLAWRLATSIPQLPGAAGASEAKQVNWDAIVGVKGQYTFGPGQRWGVPYHLDIGTGESKFTWQASAGLAYRFDWGALYATYRHLDYEMKSGKPIRTLEATGPQVGVSYRW